MFEKLLNKLLLRFEILEIEKAGYDSYKIKARCLRDSVEVIAYVGKFKTQKDNIRSLLKGGYKKEKQRQSIKVGQII